jgi:Receptor family ligand binding region/7 transmembrane sweet-taste receptor of 3 GCPR
MEDAELESPSYIQWAPDGSRLGKFVTLLGITGYGGQKDNGVVRDSSLFAPVSAFLAWRELETRSGAIVPHLPHLLEGCDMHWSYNARDTNFDPLEAVRELMEATGFHSKGSYANTTTPQTPPQRIYPPERGLAHTDLPFTEEQGKQQTNHKGGRTRPSTHEQSSFSNNLHKRRRRRLPNSYPIDKTDLHPFAMIGAFSSRVSETLATIGGALGVPQMSGSSTSAKLNQAPLFARTIATDDAKAEAFIHYMKHLGVSHVANIYIKDPFGVSFHVSLQNYADAAGIKLKGFAYNIGEEQGTLRELIESQYYIVMATIVEWEPLFKAAHQAKVMGVPEYAWFTPEHYYFARPSFELSKETDSDLALALSGIGLINVYIQPQPRFEQALNDFVRNKTLQQEFIAVHTQPEIYDNYTFQPTTPQPDEYLFFDGTLALGLASCRAQGLFNGQELYDQLLQLEFQGISGHVSFDELGNRGFYGSSYRVDNVRISQNRSDGSFYRFESTLVAVLKGGNITEISPFLFNHGENQFTTTITSPIPPLEENFNYIPQWARNLGYCLGSSVMLLSMLILAWVWRRRESYVIKAAQPPFLALLCFGTFVYSSAVFPLSLYGGGPDENTNPRKYNAACMATLWLLFLGFVVSFSAGKQSDRMFGSGS